MHILLASKLSCLTMYLRKNQLQRLDLKVSEVQVNLDLSVLLLETTFRLFARHSFLEDIDPFGGLDLDPRPEPVSATRTTFGRRNMIGYHSTHMSRVPLARPPYDSCILKMIVLTPSP